MHGPRVRSRAAREHRQDLEHVPTPSRLIQGPHAQVSVKNLGHVIILPVQVCTCTYIHVFMVLFNYVFVILEL